MTPLAPVEPVHVHHAPDVIETAPVPGFSVDRDLSLDQAGLGGDLGLDVATGSHRERSQHDTRDTVSSASSRALLLPATEVVAVAAAAFTLAGALAFFWGGVKALGAKATLPFIGLYAKITRAEVFDNRVRERIFQAIRDHPGRSASDLARLATVSWGTTIYHLDVLEQTRMVSSLREGRYRRYFENGASLGATKEVVAILQNVVTAGVIETIKRAPGATQKELASATNMTPQALHWHLARLVSNGMVRKEREGRVVKHFPAILDQSSVPRV
jgi:predicted transcriptional regulator